MHQHQPESPTHCPVLHLIHDHHPTVAGRVTSTISISLLQTLSKPGASKTPRAGGPERRAGNTARAGARGELGRSEMVPTRLCLAQAALSSLHPCKGTGALQEPSLEQSWPEGLAGSHCDKFGMSTNPWCTAGGRNMSLCVCEMEGPLQDPDSAIRCLADLRLCSRGSAPAANTANPSLCPGGGSSRVTAP